jgi:hypothetical protein
LEMTSVSGTPGSLFSEVFVFEREQPHIKPPKKTANIAFFI